jgi:hypothetical protein
MSRLLPVLMVSLGLLPAVADAQGVGAQGHRGTQQQKRACRTDVLRHCRDLQDQGDEAMANCLKANADKLSPSCRQALEAGGKR